MIVVWLFLTIPQVCLQFVILVCPYHTHFIFFMILIILFNILSVKNWFLLLKSPSLEHTLTKRISCDIIYHRKVRERHLHQVMRT